MNDSSNRLDLDLLGLEERDLVCVVAASVLCAAVVLAVPFEGLRLAAALPLTLLLPGFAITTAAFGQQRLPLSMVLLLSVGLSLATLAVGALVLNFLPGGLRATSWVGLLVLVVLTGCIVAAQRRSPTAARWLDGRDQHEGRTTTALRWGIALALIGAGLATGMALALAWKPVPAENAVGYTRLWMLPSGSTERPQMRIGIRSQEQEPAEYKLQIQVGRPYAPISSRLVLEPGQGRLVRVRVQRRGPEPVRVTALLYRRDDPGIPYRRVTGWIPSA